MCIIFTETTNSPAIHKDWFADFVTRNRDGSGVMVTAGDHVYTEKLLSDDTDATYAMYLRGRAMGGKLAFHARFRTHGERSTANLHPYEIIPGKLYMMHNGILATSYGRAKPDHPAIQAKMTELATCAPTTTTAVTLQNGYTPYEQDDMLGYNGYGYGRARHSHVGGVNQPAWVNHNVQQDPTQRAAEAFSDTWHYIEDFIRPIVNADPSLIASDAIRTLITSHIGASNKFVFVTPTDLIIMNAKAGIQTSERWLSNTYAWSGDATSNLLEPKPPARIYTAPAGNWKSALPPAIKNGGGNFLQKSSSVESGGATQLNKKDIASAKRLLKRLDDSHAATLNLAADKGVTTLFVGRDDDFFRFRTATDGEPAVINKIPVRKNSSGNILMPKELTSPLGYDGALAICGYNKNGNHYKGRNIYSGGEVVPFTGTNLVLPKLFDRDVGEDVMVPICVFSAKSGFGVIADKLYSCASSDRDFHLRALGNSETAATKLWDAFQSCPEYSSFSDLPLTAVTAMLYLYTEYGATKHPSAETDGVIQYRLACAALHGLYNGMRPDPLLFAELLQLVIDELTDIAYPIEAGVAAEVTLN